MTTSKLGLAQDKLKELLAGRAGLAGVKVDLGEPGVFESEHLWVDDRVENWTQSWAESGPLTGADAAEREEHFTLRVHAQKSLLGDNFAKARDRVLVIVAEVEKLMRENERLDATLFSSEWSAGGIARGKTQDQTIVGAVIEISCVVYLGG
jgi:hypothetical protein